MTLKNLFTTMLAFAVLTAFAQTHNEKIINQWLIAGPVNVNVPLFDTIKNVKGDKYVKANLLKYNAVALQDIKPEKGKSISGQKWEVCNADKSGQLQIKTNEENNQIYYFATYVYADSWQKVSISIKSPLMFELYIDRIKVSSKYSFDAADAKETGKADYEVKMERGNHLLMIKVLTNTSDHKQRGITLYYTSSSKLEPGIEPESFMDIHHVLEGTVVKGVDISDNGKYYIIGYQKTSAPAGKSEYWQEIHLAQNNAMVMNLRTANLSDLQFIPGSNSVSFLREDGETTSLISRNLLTGLDSLLGRFDKMNGYTWSPDGSYVLYSLGEDPEKDIEGAKRFVNMSDRTPWFRNRSFLYKYDVAKRVNTRLTWGSLSTNLLDISRDGKQVLFSTNEEDFGQRPFSRQNVYLMEAESGKAHLLFQSRFGCGAQFSPEGKHLLLTGSPLLFGESGNTVKDGKTPNDYDTQAYIYTIANSEVVPITRDFNPAVQACKWDKTGENILFQAEDKTYVKLFVYNILNQKYSPLVVNTDVVDGFAFAAETGDIVCYGTGISSPSKAFILNLYHGNSKIIADPQADFFQNIRFGKTEDWAFTSPEGRLIDGFVNYPPDFDPEKKYPLIVFYYGGTSPIDRAFEGRYPKNYFAAMGYVVYTLNPDGATGYGQDFSAMHVNNWGKTVANQIIDGTKQFLAAHSFIDSQKVGCIGASYGGFMTMYLQTQTDMFATAISHAGISNISSYWGVGYWGYQYSTVASADMYPWNNPDLYVKQSPLFSADKIKTPLLLLHGNSDTNVPPGESIQLFTALKILGRPVEMIQIDGQDHHILDYKKRILWENTILAWFDKYLKNQPDWWNDLYPDRNF